MDETQDKTLNETVDVAVIGAGPAGACAAAALAEQGWRVALIERSKFPRHKVCGEFLSPEAQSTLRELGLHASLATLAPVTLDAATVTDRRGAELSMDLPGPGWGLSRYAMDAALAAAAVERGAELQAETTALAAEPSPAGVTLRLRRRGGASLLHARTVLMAGGRQSAHHLPPSVVSPGGRPRYVGVKAHVANLTMPHQVALYLFDGGYVGINLVETGNANVCLLATYEALARAGGTPEGIFRAIADQNGAFRARMKGTQLLPETICTVAGVDTGRPAAPWDGMACLGDTATMIPPLCGDGMAMALRSAELCVPLAHAYLRGALTLDQWRDRYEGRWHAEFDRRLRTGRFLQHALQRESVAHALLIVGRVLPPAAAYFVRATRGSVDAVASPA